MQKKLVLICFFNFLIAALFGLALRYSFIGEIYINYRFLTHAHSHIAMLGWVYLMLFVLFTHYFVPKKKPIYNRLFWITQFAVIGMMLSFPFQGYAALSISFSTLHIFCSYYFVYLIWKHHKIESIAINYLMKVSLFFMLLSTIGVWCLGPAVSIVGQTSAFYQIAIQFFLHFQFNGWFLLAVIAIFFHLIKLKDSKQFRLFLKLIITSTLFTMALPINWYAPHISLLWINGLGVILQLMALVIFLKLIKPYQYFIIQHNSKLTVYVYKFALFCFILKIGIQLLSFIPEIYEAAYQHHHLVIGFIHLLMLGVITGFLFGFVLQSKLITINSELQFGIILFILGFILTECLLIIQGNMFYFNKSSIPYYYFLLFIFSVLLPLGILLITLNILKNK
ncbi:hypothetical protein APS56_14510 [Pseudalgibacter alginicilyticus]|uniref:Cytochrome oxidase subunit I profile domain-containing protein n=1 Tax=Pseudalgibacter alginicilyticus TaxID=1736674 RepID=A0A0P0D5S3_9FLAO|nr:hypothetical protein [Pseudalgibacter alginicilyticus]ALJ06273.1 hypothetical protein APS56_14510 [Pseudalgibacter alginicilyticus]